MKNFVIATGCFFVLLLAFPARGVEVVTLEELSPIDATTDKNFDIVNELIDLMGLYYRDYGRKFPFGSSEAIKEEYTSKYQKVATELFPDPTIREYIQYVLFADFPKLDAFLKENPNFDLNCHDGIAYLLCTEGVLKMAADILDPELLNEPNSKGLTPIAAAILGQDWRSAYYMMCAIDHYEHLDAKHPICGLSVAEYLKQDMHDIEAFLAEKGGGLLQVLCRSIPVASAVFRRG